VKLLTKGDLWCIAGAHETDAAVQLRDTDEQPNNLTVCPTCLIQAVGLLGLKVEMKPRDAFQLMRMTMVKEHGNADQNLDSEMEALLKIKEEMNTGMPIIWRFATGVGEDKDLAVLKSGWILEE